MTGRRRRLVRSEAGAFLPLFALMLIALLAMVAIVIDLGAVRNDRAAARRTADAAAAAGASTLLTGTMIEACNDAWSYFLANTEDEGTPLVAPDCATVFGASCDPLTARTAVGTAGQYTVSIVNPVTDTHTMMLKPAVVGGVTQPINSTYDGSPCDRVGVDVARTRDYRFAGVIGQSSSNPRSHSVGLRLEGENSVPASLVLLDQTDCNVLVADGQGSLEIVDTSDSVPGGITLDSAGTLVGCASGYTLDAGTNNGSHVTVGLTRTLDDGTIVPAGPGSINLFAMAGDDFCSFTRACNDGQYDEDEVSPVDDNEGFRGSESNGAGGYVSQRPKKLSDRVTRAPGDHRYNCQTNYLVNYIPLTTSTCEDGNPAYVHALVTTVCGGHDEVNCPAAGASMMGTTSQTVGNGSSTNCPALQLTYTGNTVFDCKVGNDTFTVNGDATFLQTDTFSATSVTVNGNARFMGPVSVTNNKSLAINGNAYFDDGFGVNGTNAPLTIRGSGTACNAATFAAATSTCIRQSSTQQAIVFVRSGEVELTGGPVNLTNSIVYGGPSAKVDLAGGATLNWAAPAAGPFEKLAFWSDLVSELPGVNVNCCGTWHEMAGGGGLNVEGVFFTPTSNWRFTGGAGATPKIAQVWANRISLSGTGAFLMSPDPSFIPVPVDIGIRMIR